MAENILLSKVTIMITYIYQHDSNIPFDGMSKTAQNQPPWPAENGAVSAGLTELPGVQDCYSREENPFPADLGFQE
jgi:hypothetical protein